MKTAYQLAQNFADFCKAHPELRFWQALREFTGAPHLYIYDPNTGMTHDTFPWKELNEVEPSGQVIKPTSELKYKTVIETSIARLFIKNSIGESVSVRIFDKNNVLCLKMVLKGNGKRVDLHQQLKEGWYIESSHKPTVDKKFDGFCLVEFKTPEN